MLKTAIAYYRHSAEDKQEFSIPVQREQIHKFAEKYNIKIIEEFEDAGKSGLSANRPGFLKLYEYSKKERFDYVLVFDVTRWGRFQDTDESAYYEVLFKREGKRVIYIDKGFIADENPLVGSLLKAIDRYMAADYSKKLSEKVFLGSMKIASLGFSVGGKAPYSLIRILLDKNKKKIKVLNDGEKKCISTDRVTFAPGNKKEILVVRRIFNIFVNKNISKREIANILNKEDTKSPRGRLWDTNKIHSILINENYIGTKVYNKTNKKLKGPTRTNPKDEWIRCENAFKEIIEKEVFYKAQKRISELKLRYTQEYLLKDLKKIYEKYKQITSNIINDTETAACANTYGRRFVSLYNAYIKVGYLPKRAYSFFKKREKQRLLLAGQTLQILKNKGFSINLLENYLNLNGKKVVITPSIPRKRKGKKYWTFYFEDKNVDYALCIGFTDKENTKISKYFLFPPDIINENVLNINALEDEKYDAYSFEDISKIRI